MSAVALDARVANRVDVVGVPIDSVDLGTAVRTAMSRVGSGSLLQICTVNLHFLVTARRDAEVRGILNRSGMNVADGFPVVLLGRLLGERLPGRVAGADLVPGLMAAAAREGARVFLLGGECGVADEAGRRLSREYPGLVVCGVHEPPVGAPGAMSDDEILHMIAASRPDILVVALGHPKQERWIDLHHARLPVSVAIGVGCSLDLIAGRRRRAPGWVQRSNLEWLYRLLHEPGRLWSRYAVDAGWLLFNLLPNVLAERGRRSPRA